MKRHKDQMADYYDRMLHEDADVAYLRLFQSFIESAPQLVLQMFIIMIKLADDPSASKWIIKYWFNASVNYLFLAEFTKWQVGKIVLSDCGAALALTSFKVSSRKAQTDKGNIGLPGAVVLFIAHLCDISKWILVKVYWNGTA